MAKKTLLFVFCLFSRLVFSADTVNVNITGNIVASPCVFNGGNKALNVNLGSIQAINMATPMSSSESVPFKLAFTQCPISTQSVTVIFAGVADTTAGGDYYLNHGTATQIAIALTDSRTHRLKGVGSSITQTVDKDRSVSIAMQARAYSSAGHVRPGTINAVVVLTIQYN